MFASLHVLIAVWMVACPSAPPTDGIRFGMSICALDDVDGDGVRDFAVGAPAALRGPALAPKESVRAVPTVDHFRGLVFVFSGETLQPLWRIEGPADERLFGHTLRRLDGDVDGDGARELLVGCERSPFVYVVSPVSGEVLARVEGPAAPVEDVDGDGVAELAIQADGEVEIRSVGGERRESIPTDAGLTVVDAVGDLDGDGSIDLLLRRDQGDGSLLMRGEARRSVPLVQPRPFSEKHRLMATPLIASANGGFALSWFRPHTRSAASAVAVYNSLGEVDWTRPGPDGESEPDENFGWSLVSHVDVDGDGRRDVLLGAPSQTFSPSAAICLSGRTGETLWSSLGDPNDSGWWDHRGTSIAVMDDRDGDAIPEVMVGGCDLLWHGNVYWDGNLRILSGRDGEQLWDVRAFDLYEQLLGDDLRRKP